MKTELEKQIDARFAEMGFPDPDNKAITPDLRAEIARQLGLFYNGHTLVVDRRQPGHLKIYAVTLQAE
jgi:hypothetical protein